MIDAAILRPRLALLVLSVLLTVTWGVRRILETLAFIHGDATSPYTLLLGLLFLVFTSYLWLAWHERPVTLGPDDAVRVDALTVCVNIPVYNEDPVLLDQVLASVFAQTRLPNRVDVVDDGSTVDYSALCRRWSARVPEGVLFRWLRTENRGKRRAQMETFEWTSYDILVTIDSDTVLHRAAIDEGLKPFAAPEVTSVAGLVLALNKRTNLLTRLEDLVVSTWQLTLRSAYSLAGSVTVNSGPFALYRSSVVQQAASGYVNERIAGRSVAFSDDSLLTLYALLAGRTVQQPSAIAFSAWPETVSHHLRQQVRWVRGSFVRSLWRLRYLPMRRVAFWLHLLGHAQFLATSLMFAFVFCVRPERGLRLFAPMLAITMLLSYAATARTLTVRRSDETLGQQLAVYALSPLVVLWSLFVFRPLRLYGMATFLRTGWCTRKTVELAAGGGDTADSPSGPAARPAARIAA